MTGEKNLPYAFGGDGATLLVPASLVPKTQEALAAIAEKIQSSFGIELRAGCVALKTLYEAGGKENEGAGQKLNFFAPGFTGGL